MSFKSAFGYNGYPIPVGVVVPYAGFLKPEGYLLCDGSPVLQADYPQLFRVLNGVGYGQNATQFNTPNLVDCFIQGTDVNQATAIPASTAGDSISFSVSEAQMPPFATNSQNGIAFSTNNISNDGLITTNGGDHTQSGGSPTQTFLGRDTTTFPAGSVSVNLSNTTASYTGTGSVQTVALTSVEPKHYTMAFYIRADY